MKTKRKSDLINFVLLIVVLILINIAGANFYKVWDFTEEKRYTLTNSTKSLLKDVDDIVFVKVLLDGDLQAGFKRLRQSTLETLKDFRSISPYIEFEFEDPSEGSVEKVNARKEELSKIGVLPTNLRINTGKESRERLIYPYALVNIGDRSMAVNLLESQGVSISDELALNNSVSLLEYKLANAIQKLLDPERKNILFTEGNGELIDLQTASLENLLRRHYNTDRINLDSIIELNNRVDLLVIAGPKRNISQRNQFIIDQYLMRGGKILWMIDYLNASLDSIAKYGNYIPEIYPLGIEDMLFKYGVRIQPNLILDLESTRIPQVVGQAGENPQTELIPYFYHPLLATKSDHPIVKGIDRVNMFFPSTIDTLKTKTEIKKTILLSSSEYSRFQITPMRLNFDILRYEPDETKFNKGPQAVAVLLEGKFESFFKNRLSQRMENMLSEIGSSFDPEGNLGQMIVISDSDFAKNLYRPGNNRISPIGYNNWERFRFKGNEQFIFNSIEYLLDENGLLEARAKDVKLRLLNKVKIQNERKKWQFINIGVPIILLIFFGLIYSFIRRKKYGS